MYEPISEKLSNEDVDLIELEREVLGTDHVEVANLLFEDWNLPASLRIPVLYHHTPEKTEKTDEQIHLSIRVQYISGIVGELLYASDSESRSLDGAKETAFESLGISHDELEALMYRVDTQMDEISGALEIGASRPNTYSNLLEEAHIALGNIVGEQERLLRELEAAKLESQKLAEQLRVANNKLLGEARTDSLTGLANRRQLGEFLRQELDRSSRYSHSLSLLFVDIDNFKSINDQYGHLEGDAALRSLAGVLTRAVRTSDLVTRFGGEEFVIALVETDREDAMPIAERVRRSVEESSICRDREGRGIHLTVSVGVATYEAKAKKSKAEILLRDADQAMYHAKTIGKNRSVHIDDCIR
jgi:diguanylate cyclase (GGDEF)-like protein